MVSFLLNLKFEVLYVKLVRMQCSGSFTMKIIFLVTQSFFSSFAEAKKLIPFIVYCYLKKKI